MVHVETDASEPALSLRKGPAVGEAPAEPTPNAAS
jgi:hypothetical protein